MPLKTDGMLHLISVRNSEWKKMDFSKYDTILHDGLQLYIRKNSRKWKALYYAVNTKLTEELADKAKAEQGSSVRFFKYDECLWNDNGTDY